MSRHQASHGDPIGNDRHRSSRNLSRSRPIRRAASMPLNTSHNPARPRARSWSRSVSRERSRSRSRPRRQDQTSANRQSRTEQINVQNGVQNEITVQEVSPEDVQQSPIQWVFPDHHQIQNSNSQRRIHYLRSFIRTNPFDNVTRLEFSSNRLIEAINMWPSVQDHRRVVVLNWFERGHHFGPDENLNIDTRGAGGNTQDWQYVASFRRGIALIRERGLWHWYTTFSLPNRQTMLQSITLVNRDNIEHAPFGTDAWGRREWGVRRTMHEFEYQNRQNGQWMTHAEWMEHEIDYINTAAYDADHGHNLWDTESNENAAEED